MEKIPFRFAAVLALSFTLVAGCKAVEEYPAYNQVLVYDRAYDYIYLRTLEAVNTFSDWVLEETDKEKGLIMLRSIDYAHFIDRDKQAAVLQVTRLNRTQTSVKLVGDSQKLKTGGEILNRIDQTILRDLSAQKSMLTVAEPAAAS